MGCKESDTTERLSRHIHMMGHCLTMKNSKLTLPLVCYADDKTLRASSWVSFKY